MKKTILLALLSLFAVNFAQAQTKQPAMVESTRDILYPEIYQNWAGFVMHYQHPATELKCIDWGFFSTVEAYDSYLWEVADSTFMPDGGSLTDSTIWCVFEHPGYIKVTVWDSIGNSGTDSIWFNIKDWSGPMENVVMEVDQDGHACFSGDVVTGDVADIFFYYLDSIYYDNTGWEHTWYRIFAMDLPYPDAPGYPYSYMPYGHWTSTDNSFVFSEDEFRVYQICAYDTCNMGSFFELTVPGMVMGTQPAPGGGWYLTMKSVMQSNKKELEGRDGEEYVYALYTVDHEGVRHPFEVDGEQVLLPTSTQAYLLPGRHPDAYYQGGIGKLTGGKDGGMEVLSYSNKVENPLPDLDDVGELNGDGTNATGLKVWPNPNNGTFTVEGEGRLKVFNLLGQAVIDCDLDGKLTLTLPSGMYLVRLVNGMVNETRKVVVE